MTSNWDRKRTMDAYLSRIPYGLRQQMREQYLKEATVSGALMSMPAPMMVGTVPGVEVKGGVGVTTSAGGSDGHTHTAFIDGDGNGRTSTDGTDPHWHSVVSFQVGPYQDPSGLFSHTHQGSLSHSGLPSYDPTPDYTGEMK